MKKVFKILQIVLITSAIIGSIAFTLYSNKEKTAERTKMVEKTVSVFPVVVSKVAIQTLSSNFNATGTFEPYRELVLVSEIQGRVISLQLDKGNYVAEGQVLAKIDDQMLQRELKIAQINYDKRLKDLQRFENLQKSNATTEVQVEEARFAFQQAEQQIEALKERLAKTLVIAPISGIITKKTIEKGSYLMPGTPIADITEINRLKMIIKVAEKDILQIKEGQTLTIKADVYPNKTFQGTIRNIAIKADASKRYEVEVDLQNQADSPIKAGMYGIAYFDFSAKGSALMIPRKAIIGSLKDAKVYVAKGDIAELRTIQTGTTQGEMVEVITGLKEGEAVIITGQINLQNGAKISIIK
ncbi:MAG: efflux RND transporter periplasmic adaptor subunit [Cytophagales bacterium]|nr:MAG: efflux RND transporter periplasmic adaptor subunit [Cytophagales bacterium]